MFSAPLTAATAIAPTIGAALAASVGGYAALFIILADAGALSAALVLGAKPPPQSRNQPGADIPAASVAPSSRARFGPAAASSSASMLLIIIGLWRC
jgi:hypothetical protein